jgi:hypothetical protein
MGDWEGLCESLGLTVGAEWEDVHCATIPAGRRAHSSGMVIVDHKPSHQSPAYGGWGQIEVLNRWSDELAGFGLVGVSDARRKEQRND